MTHDYSSARALAQQRWAQFNDFDLSDDSWDQLFTEFGCANVIEAVRCMKHARDRSPEGRYKFFLKNISNIAERFPKSSRVQ